MYVIIRFEFYFPFKRILSDVNSLIFVLRESRHFLFSKLPVYEQQ